MTFDLRDCSFSGPALPEPFVKFELETHLANAKLLRKASGPEAKALAAEWEVLRRKLRALGDNGGSVRVANHVLEPLAERLGYPKSHRESEIQTREGIEDGGIVFQTQDEKSQLRAWALDVGADFDAPNKRGHAYRFSPTRVAQRVLLAKGERLGLITDGTELRLLLCDPARPESHIAIRLDRSGGWRSPGEVPDSYRLVLALACPDGLPKIPELVEQARLTQTRVTAKLREQAKLAVTGFVQEILDDPANHAVVEEFKDCQALAKTLWGEALVIVYRLLFILKLESSPDPARAFSFASTSLWRNTYSPNTALARVLEAMHKGEDTGRMLGDGLRLLFRLFRDGLRSSELKVSPLGGMLFGPNATPLLERMVWSERAGARLLDNLLWTPKSGKIERQRVHYGSLDVEDLGRVYEALLELEPGIATEPMCRLRRQKLEVVVPLAQGAAYRTNAPAVVSDDANDEADEDDADEDEEKPARGKTTKVQWIEEIKPGTYYLRVGLGRKATGSYYTPHAFVRFLIQETLGPQVAERSPANDPHPLAILKLKVLDPAMGSGHFLVEACRFLGDRLYEACRLCDELAMAAENRGDSERAKELWQRVAVLPDSNDELVAYLPSRVLEGSESGLSQAKAIALCRRLVAVHSLYGVDKNPLAVELAKLSLWLESYAEGLPLTFLDHRLIHGDSLTGPFFDKLGTYPKSGEEVRDLFTQKLTDRLRETLADALSHVEALERTIGKDVADITLKEAAKKRLDAALAPLEVLAAAWSGGVMLGEQGDDDYSTLMDVVAEKGDIDSVIGARPALRKMVDVGKEGVAYDLVFPEVFYPDGKVGERRGFDAVVGNPPWDQYEVTEAEFWSAHNLEALAASSRSKRVAVIKQLKQMPALDASWQSYVEQTESRFRVFQKAYAYQAATVVEHTTVGKPDVFRLFAERIHQCTGAGIIGMVAPSAFHQNEGSTGIRQLYLERTGMRCCFSFENRKKLFEIDSRMKFDAIVADCRSAPTDRFKARFYLQDPGWLFTVGREQTELEYSATTISRTGGPHKTFVECTQNADLECLEALNSPDSRSFGVLCAAFKIRLTQGFSVTREDYLLHAVDVPALRAFLTGSFKPPKDFTYKFPVHEGKTFWQFTDQGDTSIRYSSPSQDLLQRESYQKSLAHYRLAFRKVAGATNERTCVFAVLPPGFAFCESACVDTTPHEHDNRKSLITCAIANSYPFDWATRLKVGSNVNFFILATTPTPALGLHCEPFLIHSALRLTCNHEGYAPLWTEQLGADTWREPAPKHTWPVLAGDDARWKVRAAIDAVVADAYGLSRDQYAHVLSSFSHKSYPTAPALCLAAFDELKAKGLEAFTTENDPYWDVPLNESLPKPVIELPIPGQTAAAAPKESATEPAQFTLALSEPKKRGRKKGA